MAAPPSLNQAVSEGGTTMPEVITCPDPTCQAPARILDRWTWGSSHGPVEHVKTGCERGHWFTPTVDSLQPQADQADRTRAAV
jgi:hypothetical protein